MLLVDQTIHLKSMLGHQFFVPMLNKNERPAMQFDLFGKTFSTVFEIGKHNIQVMSYQYSLQDEQTVLLTLVQDLCHHKLSTRQAAGIHRRVLRRIQQNRVATQPKDCVSTDMYSRRPSEVDEHETHGATIEMVTGIRVLDSPLTPAQTPTLLSWPRRQALVKDSTTSRKLLCDRQTSDDRALLRRVPSFHLPSRVGRLQQIGIGSAGAPSDRTMECQISARMNQGDGTSHKNEAMSNLGVRRHARLQSIEVTQARSLEISVLLP